MPGESQELRDMIQREVHSVIGPNQVLGMILNVDSCLSFGWKIKYPPIGEITNPYGTLTHCIIFMTTLQGYSTPTDSVSGVIGIFKDGTILWHSGSEIAGKSLLSSGYIWIVKDINRDGKVEILTNWLAGMSSPRLSNLWIVSWDGARGEIINAKDEDSLSIIQTSETWNFDLVDVEADAVWEIQGAMEPQTAEDSLRIIPESGYALYTYSWNGTLYGRWPGTPQSLYGTSYPRNKAQVDVCASTRQNVNVLEYHYKVHSLSTNAQFVQEFAIDRFVDTVVFVSVREFWDGTTPWLPIVDWTCYAIEGVNYLQPGETEPDFSFSSVGPSLPRILRFYSFGLNEGASDRRTESLDNSYRGLTIGPTIPRNSVVPMNFLDTLIGCSAQSHLLNWIPSQSIADKYIGLFTRTKSDIQSANVPAARARLDTVLIQVHIDSVASLTSEAYALLRYNTEYLLEHLPVSPPGLTVKLINSSGTRLTNGTLQYYEGSWRDAVNNNDGTFMVNTSLTSVSLRMTYEYGTQTKTNVPVGSDTAVFQTVNAQVKLQNSQSTLMDTGTVQYYAGTWRSFGTTTSGIAMKELLPASYSFRMTYAYASNDKQQDIGTNPTVVFQTINAAVQLKNSQGSLMDQGTVQYYSGAWRNFGVTTGGAATKELLSNNYSFRMYYAFASTDKQQNIGTNATVVFQTVNAIVELRNSQGNLMDQGTVQYYAGAWRSFGVTANGVATKELLPANYSFRMTHESVSIDKAQNISTNNTVNFSTVLCVVRVRDSQGQPVNNAQASYYSTAWRQIGTTVNGEVTKQLLPVNLTFRITYGAAHQDKVQNLSTNNVVEFILQP
ncbi:MAG TPA: hypothetical protein DGH68_11640 [Bacteroidetes bacterium]|nr:hypothetical protein [Bacteroidota bacterium]